MPTIKISDLIPVPDLTDSEMSNIELAEQELESVVGGSTYDPGGEDACGYEGPQHPPY